MLKYTLLSENICLVKEDSERVNRLNSIVIEEKKESKAILIDANYSFSHIDELYNRIKQPVLALIFSHFHTDHTAHAFYHEQKYMAPLFCPVQEETYFKSLSSIMDDVGFSKLGPKVKKAYLLFVNEFMKFQECKGNLNTFNPDYDVLKFNSIVIETIHIPGHSPGHTAFIIKSKSNEENRKMILVATVAKNLDKCPL